MKMKKIQSVFIILLTVFHLSAQMNQGKYVPFHFSFHASAEFQWNKCIAIHQRSLFQYIGRYVANERNFTFASIQ